MKLSREVAGRSQCDRLSNDSVERMAGVPLPGPIDAARAGLPLCIWGDLNKLGVQTINVPAQDWGTALPSLVEQLENMPLMNDANNQRKLRAVRTVMAEEWPLTAAGTCKVFSRLLEVQGQAPGANVIANFLPTRKNPQGISAQACVDGIYSSVLLARPNLHGTTDEANDVMRALDSLVQATS